MSSSVFATMQTQRLYGQDYNNVMNQYSPHCARFRIDEAGLFGARAAETVLIDMKPATSANGLMSSYSTHAHAALAAVQQQHNPNNSIVPRLENPVSLDFLSQTSAMNSSNCDHSMSSMTGMLDSHHMAAMATMAASHQPFSQYGSHHHHHHPGIPQIPGHQQTMDLVAASSNNNHSAAAAAALTASTQSRQNMSSIVGVVSGSSESDVDPRELEAFAEHFKQRRIKLGVTQADVGKALANLKLPGVGCLSQSTICRFESLTLSHNNMVALKPILAAWLDQAEAIAKSKRKEDGASLLCEKKRKRTSIGSQEKRSLEAYFQVQPRPSGEKIAAIAEKLDLKKNVVRVWFCNQRQKQKRCRNRNPANY